MRWSLAGTFFLVSSIASASIIFTHEAPSVQQTTVAGSITENFNALAAGPVGPYVSAVGTYSTGGVIVLPDAFGGANQTKYISVGIQSGTSQYDLTFGGLRTYFGFYWAAGDGRNRVDFYEGATLKATFAVSDITPTLSAAYFGNPNTGENGAEPYVYLNFTSSDLSSRFDRVVFRQLAGGGGFETDNHSVFDQLITPPGVPEPSSWLFAISGISGFVLLFRRPRRRAV